MSGGPFNLSPSRLARHFHFDCDRFLRYAATPGSLRAVEAIPRLAAAEAEVAAADTEHDTGHGAGFDPLTHALNMVSIIESVQENPGVILAAQLRRARDELMAEMKAAGVEYRARYTSITRK